MTVRVWMWLTVVSLAAGSVTWLFFRDSGIVVAIAICAAYIALLSAKLPLSRWIRLDQLHDYIAKHKSDAIQLPEPCVVDGGNHHRHAHFCEVVEVVPGEKLTRAYGAAKLSEKLLKDVQHDWERGVGGAIVLFVIWGLLTFARPQPADAPINVGFDWWKAGITAVVGFFRLASSAEVLHWFRKQNGLIS